MLINKKEVILFYKYSLPFDKNKITICKNFSLMLCKNYGKIEECPTGILSLELIGLCNH